MKIMKRGSITKIVLATMASLLLAFSAARATTITPNFTSIAGSGTQFSAPLNATPTLSSGDTLPVTNSSSPPLSGSLGPASGGPGPVTTQPIPNSGPIVDVPRVPDTGSTVLLLTLALGGLAAVRRRLTLA